MKKVLSFVLVLAMILGSVSMAFADLTHTSVVNFDKKNAKPFEDAPNSELATVLRDLKVLQGNDGKVFLDQPISRAEVCAILMRVLGYEAYCTAEYAINAASSFKDVAPGYWANGYINLAAQLGYVNGVGNGKFNPTGNVGLNDGVAFIMKALGYSAEHLPLDWPYNFLVKAEALGMLEDVEQTAGDLTREQVFTMLYNVIEEPLVKWQLTDIGLVKSDETLGYWYQIGGNFATKSAGSTADLDNYGATGSAVVCPALIASAAAAKALDLSAYEGQYVEFVNKSGKILFVSDVLSTELSGDFTSKGAVQTLAGVTILPGADRALNAKGSYVLYNGTEEEAATAFAELLTKSKVKDVTANVVLDEDGKIEAFASVELWIPTKTYKVDATAAALFGAEYDATRAAVAKEISASGIQFVVSDASVKKTDWEILGVELVGVDKFEDIKEDDVITIYADHAGYIHKIVVAREVVEGKVAGQTSTQWTINGSKYVPLIAYDEMMGVSNHAFYLDANGYIFEAKNLEDPDYVAPGYSYGFITTYASVFEQHYNADKLAIVPVTNNSISIMPLGGTEVVSFSNVSQGAMSTWMNSADANGDWKSATKAGELVAYKLNPAGGLAEMKQVLANRNDGTVAADGSTGAGLKNLKVAANGSDGKKADANGFEGKLFASDVQVIAVLEADDNNVVIANKTVADIKGATYTAVAYELNTAGKITKYFVFGNAGVVSTTTKITAAAFTEWSRVGTINSYNVLVDGKDVQYVITGEALATAGKNLEGAEDLYKLELNSLNQIVTYEAIASNGSVAAESCKYAGGVLVTSVAGVGVLNTATTISFVTPVIYAYDDVYAVIEEADVAAALKEAENVYVYNLDGDTFYDILVIK